MTTTKMARQEKIARFLDAAITKWYMDAKKDYRVIGNYAGLSFTGDTLTVFHREMGRAYQTEIVYYDDYTPEQLYNIWQESDRWEEVN